mmetsp:Transcript_76433/g.163908  ORF Transcript_76433/g.163908 Transcript_76433/m.163908 type:complete len:228 (+) Transcript_76433:453-1136(+)
MMALKTSLYTLNSAAVIFPPKAPPHPSSLAFAFKAARRSRNHTCSAMACERKTPPLAPTRVPVQALAGRNSPSRPALALALMVPRQGAEEGRLSKPVRLASTAASGFCSRATENVAPTGTPPEIALRSRAGRCGLALEGASGGRGPVWATSRPRQAAMLPEMAGLFNHAAPGARAPPAAPAAAPRTPTPATAEWGLRLPQASPLGPTDDVSFTVGSTSAMALQAPSK